MTRPDYSEASVVARKQHLCEEYAEEHLIEPGQTYVRAVAFPDGDVNTGTVPWVMRLCAEHFTGTTGRDLPPPVRRPCETCLKLTTARQGVCPKCRKASQSDALVGGQWVPNERGVMEWVLG